MITALVGLLGLACSLGGCDRQSASDGATVVDVWAHQGQERENAAVRAIVDAFNTAHKAERLRIKISFFPDRQYADKVSIAAAGGSLPDVLDIDGPYVGPWAAEGLLLPLGDRVTPALRSDMLGSLIEQGTYHDKLYALGAFESALVVYYNRDLVEKAGISPPRTLESAWTWDQFVTALERVKPYAAIPLSLHMDEQGDEWFTYAFSPLIWSNGGKLIDESAGKAKGVLDGPRNVAAIEKWQALFTTGLAEATATNPNPFSAGLAAFDWTGHWMLPTFEKTDGLRFGVMPLPKMGDNVVAASGSWCWGLSRDCEKPMAAWRVIEWFLDPEHGVKPIVEANGAVPGRRSAFQYFPQYDKLPRKLFRAQLEQAAHPRPRTRVYLTLTTEFARALRDIALGADVQQRLSRAADAVQRALDRGRP